MTTGTAVTAGHLCGVERALAGWLPAQRWFGAKDRPVTRVELDAPTVLTDRLDVGGPAGWHVVARVYLSDTDERTGRLRVEHYQIPLGLRLALPESLAGALIVRTGDLAVYDATADPELCGVLLGLIDCGEPRGAVRFRRYAPGPLYTGPPLPGRRSSAEQSNTSIVYGDRYILKLFRRLSAGVNPDVQLHRALERAGSTVIAPVRGVVEGELDGTPVTYGMLQRFVDAVDGWKLATESVRCALACSPGTGFADEARRLGAAVASVHADLAAAFGTAPLRRPDLERLSATMSARLNAASRIVPSLSLYRERLERAYRAVADLPDGARAQRVHNDLHLGQALRGADGWTIIDFEGEPAADPAERDARHSPLRDVAGMLRSFDYAAYGSGPAPDDGLDVRVQRWAQRSRAAFRAGYETASGTDLTGFEPLLHAYEVDKAVYEAVYEARNRPGWLSIPLRALDRLLVPEPVS